MRRPRLAPTDRVLDAARKIAAVQQKARDLRAQIDWQACEQQDDSDFDELGQLTYQGHPPCPFDAEATPEGPRPRDQWCAPCQLNWELRKQWAAERKKRPNHLRALERAIRAVDAEPGA